MAAIGSEDDETKSIPARTEEVIIGLECDLCGKKAKRDDWGCETYEINEVFVKITMHRKTGEMWPEEQEIDICPNCWDQVVRPFLISQGVENVVETDW